MIPYFVEEMHGVGTPEDMNDYINNEISQVDYEFVLGVSIYAIRIGHSFSEEYLRKLRNIVIWNNTISHPI